MSVVLYKTENCNVNLKNFNLDDFSVQNKAYRRPKLSVKNYTLKATQ